MTRLAMTTRRSIRWTAAEDELVRTLPVEDVVRLTGRIEMACRLRRQKLGVAESKPGWSEAADRLIVRMPIEQAAKYLGRSVTAIEMRIHRLGLKQE